MKMIYTLLVIFAASGLKASEIRLDRPGLSMNESATKDQGQFGTCYAYSTAQAIDAYNLGAKGEKTRTSPLMIAVRTKDTYWRRIIHLKGTVDGGYTCSAFRRGDGGNNDFCSEEVIEGDLSKLLRSKSDFKYSSIRNMILFLEDLHNNYKKNKKEEGSLSNYAKKLMAFFAPTDKIKSDFVPSMEEATFALKSKTNLQFLNRLFSPRCEKNSHSLDEVSCDTTWRLSMGDYYDQKFIKIIDNHLKKNVPEPTMISYCAEVLIKGKNFLGLRDVDEGAYNFEKDCYPHASIIIGKREINNTIQYLIRNSWGESCYSYSLDWQCEKGNIWVDQKAIVQNIYSLGTLH